MISAVRIVTVLMSQVEDLRLENGRLRIALFGREAEPQAPFPLLSGSDILQILHPDHREPRVVTSAGDNPNAAARRAVARETHRLIRAGASGMEIRAAILIAADEFDIASKSALTIAANILRAESANG